LIAAADALAADLRATAAVAIGAPAAIVLPAAAAGVKPMGTNVSVRK